MKLTILVDNNSHSGSCLISEHGLSFFIEDNGVNLLFDCGATDAFIKNAEAMDIDLTNITDIILSHGHADHIGGFFRLISLYEQFSKAGITFDSKRIVAHPKVFNRNKDGVFNSKNSILTQDNINEFFNLVLTTEPHYITKNLVYIGEIPLKYGNVQNDYISDETALAYKSKDGLIIFSGCSHSGVKNIIEQAKFITGENKINSIVGGLYLINRSEDEINEAVEEAANIVIGRGVSNINDVFKDKEMRITPPGTIFGSGIRISSPKLTTFKLTASTQLGDISINVGFAEGE